MRRLLTILVPVFLAAVGTVAAEDWKEHAEVRLIDGGLMADGVTRLAGLEIRLDPEWKTYWRNPGDSGIPPRMDFSASVNVADVQIEWPAPELHYDGYGWVIAYTDAVIFPLIVRPDHPGDPTTLDVRLDYAVCKDICIPAESEANIALDGTKPRVAEIEFYRARVPAAIEAAGAEGGVVAATVSRDSEVPVLELHVRLPGNPDDGFAVIEGPEGWYMPVPKRTGLDPDGASVYTVPVDGAGDPAAIAGAKIRVTGVSPGFAFEQTITLD